MLATYSCGNACAVTEAMGEGCTCPAASNILTATVLNAGELNASARAAETAPGGVAMGARHRSLSALLDAAAGCTMPELLAAGAAVGCTLPVAGGELDAGDGGGLRPPTDMDNCDSEGEASGVSDPASEEAAPAAMTDATARRRRWAREARRSSRRRAAASPLLPAEGTASAGGCHGSVGGLLLPLRLARLAIG